jgi:hypothetical protein
MEKQWIITEKEFSKSKIFENPFGEYKLECLLLTAKEINEGDYLINNKNKLFQVDYIEKEYANEIVANKYDEVGNIKEGHEIDYSDTIYQFIYEDNGGSNGICYKNIPHDAKFWTIRLTK